MFRDVSQIVNNDFNRDNVSQIVNNDFNRDNVSQIVNNDFNDKKSKINNSFTYSINSVDIVFPYNAYDIQLQYMEKLLYALQNGCNALLESPTGTGKTLAILVPCCAWQQAMKAYIQYKTLNPTSNSQNIELLANISKQVGKSNSFNNNRNPINSFPNISTNNYSRIIYCSRTHSQLQQVIHELRKTKYHPSISILGSRAQYCIHPHRHKFQGESLDQACLRMVATHQCEYHNPNTDTNAFVSSNISENVPDIEEFISYGRGQKICPFYSAKESAKNADIIFLPYNYLIDSKIRNSLPPDLLENAVIIFDEAHNLESVCLEASSFNFSSSTLSSCIDEVQQCLSYFNQNSSANKQEFKFADSKNSNTTTVTFDQLLFLKKQLLNFEIALMDIKIPSILEHNQENGLDFEASYLIELFSKSNIVFEGKGILFFLIEQASRILTTHNTLYQFHPIQLNIFANLLRLAYENPLQELNHSFRLYIYDQKIKKRNIKDELKTQRILGLWCLDPSYSIKSLVKSQPRCFIFTSGTLSPLDTYGKELNLSFPITQENSHVVSSNQISVGILTHGPKNVELNCSFKNRNEVLYLRDLGNMLVALSRRIPEGLLVFFPSYTFMQFCVEFWRHDSTAILQKIQEKKPIFYEPKSSSELESLLDKFHKQIFNSKLGGTIFGVCRGKISEGLNFSDQSGRGVVIIGIPFPSHTDPKIILRRQWLDKFSNNRGNLWYKQQAIRTINQSIGRIIRHQNDYGCIILCDSRFNDPSYINGLSKWLRSAAKIYSNFSELSIQLARFFGQNCFSSESYDTNSDANSGINSENKNADVSNFDSAFNNFINQVKSSSQKAADTAPNNPLFKMCSFQKTQNSSLYDKNIGSRTIESQNYFPELEIKKIIQVLLPDEQSQFTTILKYLNNLKKELQQTKNISFSSNKEINDNLSLLAELFNKDKSNRIKLGHNIAPLIPERVRHKYLSLLQKNIY